jgi:hypothetical protein
MGRMLFVVTVSCLCMTAAAVAQNKIGSAPPPIPPESLESMAWGFQEPGPTLDETIDIGDPDETPVDPDEIPVDPAPPIGSKPPVVGDGLTATAHESTAQGTVTEATYAFFFSHLDHLDREADRQAALGNEPAAKEWRSHEQLAAGLDAQEASLLKQVAYDCNLALRKKDAEIQTSAAAFHAASKAESHTATPPLDLQVLWQDRVQIIHQHIDRLRSLLGEERFRALDSYVLANFAPVQVSPAAAAAKGGSR